MSPNTGRRLAGALILLSSCLLPLRQAQSQVLKKLKGIVKGAAEQETAAQIDRLVRDKIRCVFDDLSCIQAAEAEGKGVVLTDDSGEILIDGEGQPVSDPDVGATLAGEAVPGEGVWTNYDFVPGERVLFYEDYAADNVGDFPRRMEFVRGNWEIVEWQARRLLRNTGPRASAFKINLPRELPERFTVEIDVYLTQGNQQLLVTTAAPATGKRWTDVSGNVLRIGAAQGSGVEYYGNGGVKSVNPTRELEEGVVPIRLMVDGRYAKVYVGERRVANVPNATFPRGGAVYIENGYQASDKKPLYLGPIRIAEGGRDLYDKLVADGRVATHGILFAVNSARIRPESTPTLEEIGKMLTDHPELRLRIEGHTDATGDDASNQTLSEARANAARDFLIASNGIDAGRIEAQGLGESKPVDDNETAEGRQNNRRVELVRLED